MDAITRNRKCIFRFYKSGESTYKEEYEEYIKVYVWIILGHTHMYIYLYISIDICKYNLKHYSLSLFSQLAKKQALSLMYNVLLKIGQ